jgi:hypothetical protein
VSAASISSSGPWKTTSPAPLAAARPQLDQVVGDPHRLGVVLHHQHGVARVAQAQQEAEQPLVVRGVQPDGRLVQHVERVHQPLPSALASEIRCASPPESVRVCRSSVR